MSNSINRVKYFTKEDALCAVKRSGNALGWVSTQLKDDYDVVYAAITNNGSLYSASHRLQNDISLFSINAENQLKHLDPLCCDFPEIIFGAKNNRHLLELYKAIFFDWEEFNLEMKLFYGDTYISPIDEYNLLSKEELTEKLLICRKQLVENCLEVYKKTRNAAYSYESIKRNKRLSNSIRHRFLRWNITSWEKVEKPASYIVDIIDRENNRIKKWISETAEKTGGSYPERFMCSVLKSLGVDFCREQVFAWSKGKRYDFYIPYNKTIIEVHGAQHYEGGFEYFGGQDLAYEQKNDTEKERMAKENGIDNYITVNAMNSSFSYIKRSLCDNVSFCKIFNCKDIDWDNVLFLMEKMQKPFPMPLYEEKIKYNEILIQLFKDAIESKTRAMSAPKKTSAMLFFEKCLPSENGLKPHEILLLEKVATFQVGKTPEHIAAKWSYNFHEDIEDQIDRFLKAGLLGFADITERLEKVNVPILKKILLEQGFDAIGKKEEIINKLKTNFDSCQLNSLIPTKFYELTSKGKQELTENRYLHSYLGITLKARIRLVNAYPTVDIKYLFEDVFKHPRNYFQYLEKEDKLNLGIR